MSYKWFNELIWYNAIVSMLASLSSTCRPCQPELSQLTKDRKRLEVGHTFRQQEKDKINNLSKALFSRVTYIITLICYLTAPLLSVPSCWHILWSLFFQSYPIPSISAWSYSTWSMAKKRHRSTFNFSGAFCDTVGREHRTTNRDSRQTKSCVADDEESEYL